jgi:hypothetical protein
VTVGAMAPLPTPTSAAPWPTEDLRDVMPFVSDASAEVDVLTGLLYQDWYLGIRPARPRNGTLAAIEIDPAQALLAAHAASARFHDGWRALRVSSAGRVEASDGEEVRVLKPGEYVCRSHPGRRPRPGDDLAVTRVRSAIEHGCWISRSPGWQAHDAPLTRVYVNVHLTGAPTAVALLTGELESWGGSYALKVFLDLGRLQRPDALVLYMRRADFHREIAVRIRGPLETLSELGLLEPDTPRLTAQLVPGVAAADGVADGTSYGMDRCALIAAAVSILPPDRRTEAGVTSALCAAFAAGGLDITRPYLASADSRDYDTYG